ncbi:MAG TPA: GNVR domain-containing protein, partial [Rhabdochlamydiaceae bacterium]
SDSVLTDVVKHTNLQTIFKAKNLEDARVDLTRKTNVSTDSSGFVKVTVTDRDPKLAYDIANSYLTALTRTNDRLAVSEASQQKLLFQRALENEKDALEDAEVELKKAQESSGVVLPQSQTLAGLYAIDTTRSQIRLQQVRLASLLQSETAQSPSVVRAQSEIQALESQLHLLESGAQGKAGAALSAAHAPSVNLEFVRLEREVKYHQALFDVTAKQYENARMEETSAAPGVQVVDFPEVPLEKSWPPRALFSILGGITGFLLAVLAIFVNDRWNALRENPEKALALRGLREAFTHAKHGL